MSSPKISSRQKRLARRLLLVILFSIVLLWAVSIGRSRVDPSIPVMDTAALTLDTVKRGELVREVRGVGTLVSEGLTHIPAPSAGRVERINCLAGAKVRPDQVIVELRNPDVERQALDAAWNVQAAEIEIANLRAQIQSQAVTHRSELAALQAQYRDAKLKNDRDQLLYKQGLMLELDYQLSTASVGDLLARIGFEREKAKASDDSLAAQLAGKEASLKQLREILQLRREAVAALNVRSGASGTLSQVLVQTGQQIALGTDLAIVVQPNNLKAVLLLPETQVRDVRLGQKAEIASSRGRHSGRVTRIDPAVANGVRMVDISFTPTVPAGLTPDEDVDGTIEVERLADVVYLSRSASAPASGEVSVFKVLPSGKEAVRVRVRLGRSSLRGQEVLSGLTVGDRVINSDTSALERYERIQLR